MSPGWRLAFAAFGRFTLAASQAALDLGEDASRHACTIVGDNDALALLDSGEIDEDLAPFARTLDRIVEQVANRTAQLAGIDLGFDPCITS